MQVLSVIVGAFQPINVQLMALRVKKIWNVRSGRELVINIGLWVGPVYQAAVNEMFILEVMTHRLDECFKILTPANIYSVHVYIDMLY